jgi:proteasome assembly chaperone 3
MGVAVTILPHRKQRYAFSAPLNCPVMGSARINPRPLLLLLWPCQIRANAAMISRQSSSELGGRPTDFLITTYQDRILVLITQLGTLGTVLHAEKETVLGGGSTFRVDTLLGHRDDPLPELCARQLVEQLAAEGCTLPLLLCLSLDQTSLRKQEEIIAHVKQLWQP